MSLGHGASIVRSGLVLQLDAANKKSYPGSGTAWNDMSSNGYTNTLVSAGLTTVDSAQCFNVSTSAGLIYDAGAGYTLGASHTLMSWARPLADSQVTTWRTLWRNTPDDHPLLIQNDSNLLGYYDNNTSSFISYGLNAGTLGIENRWTMFTVVGLGGSSTIYINGGTITGTVAYSAAGTAYDTLGNSVGGAQPFGYVATSSIYNRALSLAEITQNFNALRGRFGI